MNVAMLQLGSTTPKMNSGKSSLKTGDPVNVFSNLLLAQNNTVDEKNNGGTPDNREDILKEILQILKHGLSDTNGLGFTNDQKISDDQISNLLGKTKDQWKDQLKDLTDSLLSLFSHYPQFLSQIKDAKKALDEGNNLQGISELISAFVKLPSESIQQIKGTQLHSLAKNAKAIEILAKTVDLTMGDIKQLTQLNKDVKNVIAKIEQLIKDNKLQNRNTILQSTFTTILKDQQSVPSGISKDQQSVSSGLSKDQQSVSSGILKEKDTNTPLQTNLLANIQNPISKTEQFILHVGKETPTSYNQFVKEFTNILAKSQLTTRVDGTNKLLIKLYPEHLGSIRIELLQDKGNITAKMFASSGAAKDLLDSQMNQLKDAFSMQNIHVDKIDVVYGQSEAQKFGQSDSRQQSPNHDREAPKQEKEEENEIQFSNLLSESLLEKIV